MPQLNVQQLFEERRDKLQLTWIGGHNGASRVLTNDALNRPGVGLVGHMNLVHPILIQAIGESDLAYLRICLQMRASNRLNACAQAKQSRSLSATVWMRPPI